jgi:hypothetical protein
MHAWFDVTCLVFVFIVLARLGMVCTYIPHHARAARMFIYKSKYLSYI